MNPIEDYKKMNKSLDDYSIAVGTHSNDPHTLSILLVELSARFAYLSERLVFLERYEAKFWQDHKFKNNEKPLSDKTVKMLYLMTEEGNLHNQLEKEMKAIKMMHKAIDSATYVANTKI